MTPSIGRIVITAIDPAMNNSASEAPAVITRVWNEHPDGGWVVNLRVLCDSENFLWRTSVRLTDTRPEFDSSGAAPLLAWWPPRV